MRTRFILLSSVFALFVISLFVVSVFPVQRNIGQALSVVKDMTVPELPLELPLSGGSSATTYVYGKALVAKSSDGALSYHLQDMLSTNSLVTDVEVRLQSRFTSYPYGKPLTKERFAQQKQKYTYTGKEDDGHLMYYGARYMDARTGRFASVDPALSTFANYDYANDNPMTVIDPTGLEHFNVVPDSAGEVNPGEVRTDQLSDRDKDFLGSTMIGSINQGSMGVTTFYRIGGDLRGMVNSEGLWFNHPKNGWQQKDMYGFDLSMDSLRTMAGEKSYMEKLKDALPAIALSIVASGVMFNEMRLASNPEMALLRRFGGSAKKFPELNRNTNVVRGFHPDEVESIANEGVYYPSLGEKANGATGRGVRYAWSSNRDAETMGMGAAMYGSPHQTTLGALQDAGATFKALDVSNGVTPIRIQIIFPRSNTLPGIVWKPME